MPTVLWSERPGCVGMCDDNNLLVVLRKLDAIRNVVDQAGDKSTASA